MKRLMTLETRGPAFQGREHHDTVLSREAAWWGSQAKGWLCELGDPNGWKSPEECAERAVRCARFAAHSARFVLPPYVEVTK